MFNNISFKSIPSVGLGALSTYVGKEFLCAGVLLACNVANGTIAKQAALIYATNCIYSGLFVPEAAAVAAASSTVVTAISIVSGASIAVGAGLAAYGLYTLYNNVSFNSDSNTFMTTPRFDNNTDDAAPLDLDLASDDASLVYHG